MVTGFTPIKHV